MNIEQLKKSGQIFFETNKGRLGILQGKGWVGWETFAGTKFWGFEKARKYVRRLNLNGAKEWKKYASSVKRIDNIPSNPWGVYVEWDGLKDWLG